MRDRTKIRWGAVVGIVSTILVVGLGPAFAQGYPVWVNESVKDLDADVPILDDTVTESDYTVTYTYVGSDTEQHVVEITGAALSTLGVSTGSASYPAELRLFGVDLGAVTLATPAVFDNDKDLDHYVTIQLPETADIVWEETIRAWCSGFTLDRGAAPLDASTYVFAQDYRLTIGSGDATLYTVFLDEESDHVSATTGDATSNRVGTCLDREDINNVNPEFGDDLSQEDAIDFKAKAYDGKDPSRLWIRVHGPRSADSTGDELGDAFDVALQLYSYDPEQRTEYKDGSVILVMTGFAGMGGAVIILAGFRPNPHAVRSNTHRKPRQDPFDRRL